jgi:SAM-dependent MidA family methyltransferase
VKSAQPTPLEAKLLVQLKRHGPMTFAEFMRAALYDPELGYYNTERLKIGPSGDYYTSSNSHPLFAALLASAFSEMLAKLDHFNLVEMGAGTGHLARQILQAMARERRDIFSRLSYFLIETSPTMVRIERSLLEQFRGRVAWRQLSDFDPKFSGEPIEGVFFSNELVDAMPVHRVRIARGRLQELYIDIAGDRLIMTWGEPSTKELAEYLRKVRAHPVEGQILEINLEAIDWLAALGRSIKRGFLVTIDYGDLTAQLYGPDRRAGTLRSFYRHQITDSPLERIGEQDITASVNFTALIEYGRDFGFEAVSFEPLYSFLARMGLAERIAALDSLAKNSIGDIKDRLALKSLFVPGGITHNFRVLIQRRGENY